MGALVGTGTALVRMTMFAISLVHRAIREGSLAL